MSRTLCLGKNGDILSVLCCLQAEFKETGVKPSLIVAKEYAALPKALPWLHVEEFDGSFESVGNAVRWAKRFGKIDFFPMMSGGQGYATPKREHPSFQLDQWSRMGRLHQWKELTLELPRTVYVDRVKEWQLNPEFYVAKGHPFILLSDHSQSSPFAPIQDLHDSLKKTFPSHSILRCSTIRLPLLTGLLTLMDEADLIVAIDSAPLHLSRACKTPVIALVTDQPGTWHGSAWHPRFAAHIRYSDYSLRKSELLHVAKKILKTS